jgi:Flp pilus assembly pilin Flp
VYQKISGSWTQLGADIDGEAANNFSGYSVSLSSDGTTVAIGAYGNDGSGDQTGSVRVYRNVSGTWTQLGGDIDGEADGDRSGWSVSISGDGTIVAIGAFNNDGSGTDSGSVRVYQNVSGTWTQLGGDIDGEAANDHSGRSVSLSSDGTTVAIGAQFNDGSGADAGSVRVYKNVSGTWTQLGADIDGETAGDRSGFSVSLSSDGTTVAIGAPFNGGSGNVAGSVRVYQNVSGTWTQLGTDIDGEAAEDFSGNSVSLSSDGTIVAIGAPSNDGSGANAGSVRVYQNVSGSWNKIGADIDGEAAVDSSGTSVSLSGDGTTVAIGAPENDGSGNAAGHVRVYDLTAVLSSDSFVLSNFSIFPNPASEQVTITLQENLQLEKVNIYNTLGQLVKTEKNSSINVSSLSKGSYYFEVITNQGKATKTVLVQ